MYQNETRMGEWVRLREWKKKEKERERERMGETWMKERESLHYALTVSRVEFFFELNDVCMHPSTAWRYADKRMMRTEDISDRLGMYVSIGTASYWITISDTNALTILQPILQMEREAMNEWTNERTNERTNRMSERGPYMLQAV